MKLAAAQLRSIAGDIPANLAMHVEAGHRLSRIPHFIIEMVGDIP